MSRMDDSRREADELERFLSRQIPNTPCSADSTRTCIPFGADDVVRVFYASVGIDYEERCIYCGRTIQVAVKGVAAVHRVEAA